MKYYNWQEIHKQSWAFKPTRLNWRTPNQLKLLLNHWDEQKINQAGEWLSQNLWCNEQQFGQLVCLADHNKKTNLA